MMIELAKLKANPYRDFNVDPIDRESVERLTASISEYGFWGGVVCRKHNGEIQIGAGHHRVEAAIKAGLKKGDITITKLSEEGMIGIYAEENATQRDNTATAIAGSIASAIRFLAKQILTEQEDLQNSAELLGNLQSVKGKGLGRDAILRFLQAVPGIKQYVVEEQLINLKKSGDYARIIREVVAQVKQEQEELRRIAEEKHKEKEKAKAEKIIKNAEAAGEQASEEKYPKEFDFKGVAQHLKNAYQVRIFREKVTEHLSMTVPFEKQAELAAKLVQLAKAHDKELSGDFIRDWITILAQDERRAFSKQPEELTIEQKFLNYQDEFCDGLDTMNAAGSQILRIMEKHRGEFTFRFSNKLREHLTLAQQVVNKLAKEIL